MAGCTTAIDSAHSVISIMGTRFLLVRLHGNPDLAGSAFDHVGHEQPMRDQLRIAVRGLLEHLPGEPYDKAEVREPMIALASYVARARSPVDRDQRSEIRLVLDPEAPTRIVKMLTQLWRAAGVLGLAKQDAWAMVRRIGLDSIPKLRREVLNVLADVPSAAIGHIAELVQHPMQTTRRALEDLAVHHAVTRGRCGKADHWQLHPEARAWLEQTVPVLSHTAVVVPVSSERPHALSERKRSDDDKTGKVSGAGG
jgi:hypothetical protein